MRFGPLPTDRAAGAVLAHSVALPKGRLRKGHVLTATDIASLQSAGVDQVVVAQYGPDDVPEDAAAAMLAKALTGPGLRATNAFTGRVNLLAEGPGVACVDAAKVDALNAVHPMITVATVPPLQQMASGGMVATIKIISYAVPHTALDQAILAGQAALSLAGPVLNNARLIEPEAARSNRDVAGAGWGFL